MFVYFVCNPSLYEKFLSKKKAVTYKFGANICRIVQKLKSRETAGHRKSLLHHHRADVETGEKIERKNRGVLVDEYSLFGQDLHEWDSRELVVE